MRPKIGFLSTFDPSDRHVSSGTNYMMAQKLREIGDVTWLPITTPKRFKFLHKALGALSRLGLPDFRLGISNALKSYHKFPKKETLDQYDVIVAFFINNMIDRAHTSTPIIHMADAVMPILLDYYPNFRSTPQSVKNLLIKREKGSLPKAQCVVMPSQWAADGAEMQGVSPQKIKVVEFGANLDDTDIKAAEIRNPQGGKLTLLFLGAFWERKGGNEAVEATEWLNKNGISATLRIVGATPPAGTVLPDFVELCGFKNKNNPKEYAELLEIIESADALILPTKAECAGIAFAEASAYGLPSFTYDTGGVGNYVVNNLNGFRLPIESSGADFGKKIKETYDSGLFPALSEGAIRLYNDRLNWNHWASEMENIINTLICKAND